MDKKKSLKTKIKKFVKQRIRVSKGGKVGFSQTVYIPRWRLKNYYAVQEFGPNHIRWFIEQRYAYMLNKFPDLDQPKLFNEKIHWLNLHYHNPLVTRCCDKYEMKKYVEEKVGKNYVVPTIKCYAKASDISFNHLPKKFAIKVNWGDGEEFSEIVADINSANLDMIKTKMNNAMQPWNNLYYSNFFWGYKNVIPKIMVESFLETGGEDLVDYKIHCFNGIPKIVLVCEGRFKHSMFKTFLDIDWNVLECHRKDTPVNLNVKKPENFDKMLEISMKLSEPFPFVRIDMYNIRGKIYVGEMTFHPGGGWENFVPEEWNRKLGDMINLPSIDSFRGE